jgi:hypothetical protein
MGKKVKVMKNKSCVPCKHLAVSLSPSLSSSYYYLTDFFFKYYEQTAISSMGKSEMTPMRLQNLFVASRPIRLHVPMSTHMPPTKLYLRGVRNGTRGLG